MFTNLTNQIKYIVAAPADQNAGENAPDIRYCENSYQQVQKFRAVCCGHNSTKCNTRIIGENDFYLTAAIESCLKKIN